MSTIIQGISSSGINGCISYTSSIYETDHNMSTNAKLSTCDIKTNHVISNEAADASSEVEISSNMPVTKNVVKRKQDKPDKGLESNLELFLDQFGLNLTGNIIVMLSRMWDVSAVIGRYLSIDFVVSDAKGNMIYCSAKVIMSHNFLRLKERGIYSVKNFAVKPNKDEYRILKNDAYMIEFYRSTTIRKALVKANGFVRYPFQLQDFDGIKSSDNKYLIDKVYLSSTSSTVIYDDDVILAIKALKKQTGAGTLENLFMWARNRKNDVYCFLPNLFWIYHSSITPNLQCLSLQSITFHCKVTIDGIRTRKGWNFPSCGGDTCKKALTRQDGQFFCQSCNKTVDYPVLRYRLEVDVSDNTAQAVVVMFNKTATTLVNCSADSLMDTMDNSSEDHLNLSPALSNLIGTAHVMEIKSYTYYESGTFESFTCWQILPSEGIDDSMRSSNLDDYPDNQPQKMKRII
nr:hypothetical protein [Tanacetum cinerariifolium]